MDKPAEERSANIVGETEEALLVKIRYEYPDPQLAVFANHMAVQQDDNEVLISFYQLTPPLAIPGPEAMREQIERTDGMVARCVAKVAISKGRMPGIIAALNQNTNKRSRNDKVPQANDSHPQET